MMFLYEICQILPIFRKVVNEPLCSLFAVFISDVPETIKCFNRSPTQSESIRRETFASQTYHSARCRQHFIQKSKQYDVSICVSQSRIDLEILNLLSDTFSIFLPCRYKGSSWLGSLQ